MRKTEIERVLREAVQHADKKDADNAVHRAKLGDWYTRDKREANRLQHLLSHLVGSLAYHGLGTDVVSEFQKAAIFGTNPLMDAPADADNRTEGEVWTCLTQS